LKPYFRAKAIDRALIDHLRQQGGSKILRQARVIGVGSFPAASAPKRRCIASRHLAGR